MGLVALVAGAIMVHAAAVWAWGDDGHYIVATIAADHLTPTARAQVALILGVPDDPPAVAAAMARASILPDYQFKEEDRATSAWHYIDLCLQDTQHDEKARCPAGNCVTARIDDYASRLRRGVYDRWGADGDLAFLIHLVGDEYQPLHAANNEDLGGNCDRVRSQPPARNLHSAWDNAVVFRLEDELGARGPAAARRLEKIDPPQPGQLTWRPGEAQQIAWQSHEIAIDQIYRPLGIAEQPCAAIASCRLAPRVALILTPTYMNQAAALAGLRLAAAGYSLAALLNTIWPQPPAH